MPKTKYISLENLRRFKEKVYLDKQDILSAAQINAVNSGVTSTKVNIYDTIEGRAIGTLDIVRTSTLNSHRLTFTAKDLNNVVLAVTNIDLPYGSTVTALTYTPSTKKILLRLNDGNDFEVELSNLATQDDLNNLKVAIESDLGYVYKHDEETTDIQFAFERLVDKTYSANAENIELTIPVTSDQGFEAGVVVKTGDTVPPFSIENLSETPLKMIQFGRVIESYTPAPHSTITFLLYNDRINNNLLIYEVPDSNVEPEV